MLHIDNKIMTIERCTDPEVGVKAFYIEHHGCVAHIEVSTKAVWILDIETEPECRHRGAASRVITMLLRYCALKGKIFVPGTYIDEGRRYLKPLIDRLGSQLNVRVAVDR